MLTATEALRELTTRRYPARWHLTAAKHILHFEILSGMPVMWSIFYDNRRLYARLPDGRSGMWIISYDGTEIRECRPTR